MLLSHKYHTTTTTTAQGKARQGKLTQANSTMVSSSPWFVTQELRMPLDYPLRYPPRSLFTQLYFSAEEMKPLRILKTNTNQSIKPARSAPILLPKKMAAPSPVQPAVL
jgi:hypothetical protein